MAAGQRRGSVTQLADAFSPDTAQVVAKHVQAAVAQLEQQVRDLERFAEENLTLSRLVRQLPDAVSHQVMVPFGKVAFFPGRLVHTNEFMVLLGERYYAERSAKQTVQFLARRGEYLDSKLTGVKAQIADLRAEAAFARTTAEEAAAGMVEIREEYHDQPRLEEVGEAAEAGRGMMQRKEEGQDEDHERVMARLAELEVEEADAEEAEGEEDTDEESWEDEEDGGEEGDAWIQEFLNPALRRGSLLPGRLAGHQEVDEESQSEVFGQEEGSAPLEQQLGYGRPPTQGAAGSFRGILAGADVSTRTAKPGRRVRFADSLVEQNVVERLQEPTGVAVRGTLADLAEVEEYRKKGAEQPVRITVPQHMETQEVQDPGASPVSGRDEQVSAPTPQRRFAPNSPFPGARRAFTGAVVEHGDGSSVEQRPAEQQKRPLSRFRKQMEGT